MLHTHWQYFLALEAEFEATTRYVELSLENYKTFSIEYARLLLSASSEIDVVCKLLCNRVEPSTKVENIDQYRQSLLRNYPKFPSMRAVIPLYGLEFFPWQEWDAGKNPTWWRSYNKVKHERNAYFQEANLENTLHALTGLFCLLLYFYQSELYNTDLQPFPKLIDYEKFPGYLLVNPGVELPDFPRA